MGDKYQILSGGSRLEGPDFNATFGNRGTPTPWDGLFEGSSSYYPAHPGDLGLPDTNGDRYKKGSGSAITKEGSTWWLRLYYCATTGGSEDCTQPAWIGSKTMGSDPSGYYSQDDGQQGLVVVDSDGKVKTMDGDEFTPIEVKRYCDCQHDYIKVTLTNFNSHGSSMNKVYMFTHYPASCSYEWASSHPDNTGGMCTLYYTGGVWQFFAGMAMTHAWANVTGACPTSGTAITGDADYIDGSNYPTELTDTGTIHIYVGAAP